MVKYFREVGGGAFCTPSPFSTSSLLYVFIRKFQACQVTITMQRIIQNVTAIIVRTAQICSALYSFFVYIFGGSNFAIDKLQLPQLSLPIVETTSHRQADSKTLSILVLCSAVQSSAVLICIYAPTCFYFHRMLYDFPFTSLSDEALPKWAQQQRKTCLLEMTPIGKRQKPKICSL